MKKRLLTLGTLALAMSMNAQNTALYVGESENTVLTVKSNALLYSGGNLKVAHKEIAHDDSPLSPEGYYVQNWGDPTFSGDNYPVHNEGNIKVVGDYLYKGLNAVYNLEGISNKYIKKNDYGQLIVSGSKNATTGLVRVEMKEDGLQVGDTRFAYYPVALPFSGSRARINAFLYAEGGLEDVVKGMDRYDLFALQWDNATVKYDAMGEQIDNKKSYSFNTKNQQVLEGVLNRNFNGIISPTPVTDRVKGVIGGLTEEQFSELPYNDWKKRRNVYNEEYRTYIDGKDTDTNSKVFNKNQFRYGNPYTSNIDLSAVEGANAWVKIKNKGLDLNIKQASTQVYIKNFTVRKPNMGTFSVGWNDQVGSVNKKGYNYYTAVYNGTQWTGNGEALLVRPLETFTFNFPVLDPTKLGSRIIEVEFSLNDNHKTFAHTPSAQTQAGNTLSKKAFNSTLSKTAVSQNTAIANANDFYQLEIALVKNEVLEEAPVYLVGANYNKETGTDSKSEAKIFVYGIKDDEVALTSKKAMNDFNSLSYVAKPLGLGLNKLNAGENYELKFNLYEASIFNKVKELNGGSFFIKDKETNKITEISAETSIPFTAGENLSERFVLYWKQVPETEKVVEVVEVPKAVVAPSAQSTIVYKEGLTNKVRFENNLGKARVEVYDLAGRLISASSDINTAADHTLTLGVKGVYIVKVSYENGEVRTQKLINE